MKEQTKIRLDIITSRHARRLAEGGEEGQAAARALAFAQGYERALDEVVRPAMEEIGAELSGRGTAIVSRSARPGGTARSSSTC